MIYLIILISGLAEASPACVRVPMETMAVCERAVEGTRTAAQIEKHVEVFCGREVDPGPGQSKLMEYFPPLTRDLLVAERTLGHCAAGRPGIQRLSYQ